MVDFKNKTFFKLKAIDNKEGEKIVSGILIPNEKVFASFGALRDKLVFTDKRIISINVQGITGAKKDFTSIPYSRIQTYSVETAGTLDLDAELDITISGLGTVRFELTSSSNIKEICAKISEKILN